MIYQTQALSSSVASTIPEQHQKYVQLFESVLTFSKLLQERETQVELNYKEMHHTDKITAEFGNGNKISLFLNKKNENVDIEFTFDFENSKLMKLRREEFLNFIDQKYKFITSKDYFGTTVKLIQGKLNCYLKFEIPPTFDQIAQFVSDATNRDLDGGFDIE